MYFVLYVAVRMGLLDDMVVQWDDSGLYDVVIIIYSLFLIVLVITSNSLFADFIASKPEGRKTAVGEFVDKSKVSQFLLLPLSGGQCGHQ